jgi:hypothetical protein
MDQTEYTVEVENTAKVFRFRLRQGQRKTGWCNYEQIAMLDDCVAVSPYYHGGQEITIMPMKELLGYITIGECKEH